MVHKFIDRCKETTSTTGTGNLTLTGAVAGFVSVSNSSTGLTSNGDTSCFCAEAGAQWEVFLGTRVSATELARTTLLASSTGSTINFSSAPTVFATVPAAELKLSADKVSAYLAGAANSTTAGWQKVPIDTAEYDTNSLFSAGSNRITIKKAGYYQVTWHARMGTSATFSAAVYKNAALLVRYGEYANELSRGGSMLVQLAVGDTLELWAYAASVRAFTTGQLDTFIQAVGPL